MTLRGGNPISGGIERAFTALGADDAASGSGFHTIGGAGFQVSWVSQGRPVYVEATLVFVKDATAAPYIWGYIDLLGGSSTGTIGIAAFEAGVAGATITLHPLMRFSDPAGTARTVGAGFNLSAAVGNATPKINSALWATER